MPNWGSPRLGHGTTTSFTLQTGALRRQVVGRQAKSAGLNRATSVNKSEIIGNLTLLNDSAKAFSDPCCQPNEQVEGAAGAVGRIRKVYKVDLSHPYVTPSQHQP